MRNIVNINRKWAFRKGAARPDAWPAEWDIVNLPHTWNNIDGQDGDNDYWRGTGVYVRPLRRADLPRADVYFLEINGANSSAEVWLNGEKLAAHDGGYSTWRVDLTRHLQEENLLVITVDNAPNDHVYPQVADFTFYGGLYRDVNVICLPATHFDLSYYGGCGLHITPEADGRVQVESWVSGPAEGTTVRYTIRDAAGQVADEVAAAPGTARLEVASPHLWQGRRDPYLYTLTAELLLGDTLLDTVSRRFGFRSYKIDPDRGFFLNGQSYPLHGVSRHQDGWGVGNALTKEDHIRDMDLICEVGANTIRLAHYQHDQFFYDLCDERGMVVWAEIPYISQHMPGGRQNTLDQMRELIVQNHKGLVTFDRKCKKDAFYAYKAWLSDEPFVHLCGKRFVNHTGETVQITVYSNQPEVELFANGSSLGVQKAPDHFFRFTVPNRGKTHLEAVAGTCRDTADICHVETPDERYRLREQGAILNWFDITEKEGYFSLNDLIRDIVAVPAGKQIILQLLDSVGMGDQGTRSEDFARMIGGFTVLRLSGLVGTLGENKLTKEKLLAINAQLNTVPRA